MINLIMPMGGKGARFGKHSSMPKPLIELEGKPFFYWACQSIYKYVNVQSLIFVVLKEHIEKYGIDSKIQSFYPEARIAVLEEVLNGPVLTCLEGIKLIDNDLPVVFNDCDHAFHAQAYYNFCNVPLLNIAGAVLTFQSRDPKFSYAQIDSAGLVVRTAEKKVISDNAICGAYYFRNRDIFEELVGDYIHYCHYSELFMSGLYNRIKSGPAMCFKVDDHVPFGTPEEYEHAVQNASLTQMIMKYD